MPTFTGVETKGAVQTQSVTIDTDLSAKEGFFGVWDASVERVVNIAAGATAPLVVIHEGGDGSSTAINGTIATGGETKMKTGGNVSQGDFLTSDGSGQAITTVTNLDFYGAIAQEDGLSGDFVAVKVLHGQVSS